MRVAALYDIHGNLPALEAVLAAPLFSETDAVLVGGDVVAGPQPREVLELLLGLGDRVRFIRGNGHAAPRSDMELVTPWTPVDAVLETLAGVAQETVVCGHIHVAYEREIGRKALVNPGSVGRPNQRPAVAYWARLGVRPGQPELMRTEYDVERSIAAIGAAGYPSDDLAATLGRPPRAAETIAHFEGLRGP